MKNLKVTALSNGIRIASVFEPSHFCSVGVFVNVGSRNETNLDSGHCYMIDKMSFKSTKDFTAKKLIAEIETMGGNITTSAHREHLMLQASIFKHDLKKMVKVMSQMTLFSEYNEIELEEAKTAIRYELPNHQWKFDSLLPEYLHSAAFRSDSSPIVDEVYPETLGRPLTISFKSLEQVTTESLFQFKKRWFTPDRICVVGVGVEHDQLVDYCNQYFISQKKSDEIDKYQKMNSKKSNYTGGTRLIDSTHLPKSPNPDDMYLSYIHIAYEAMHAKDPDIYALSTLASLLGGGGSFSAGGPGKGMYTRLYTQVLNKSGWVESCNRIIDMYRDTSLFGISAAILPDIRTHHHIVPVICDQLVALTQSISDEELFRAKNQLKSQLLMNLESKLVQLENIGKQIMNGDYIDIVEICKRIDSVDKADLVRCAKRVLFKQDLTPRQKYPGFTEWKASTSKLPTVLFHGPIYKSDSILKVNETLEKWDLNGTRRKKWYE